MGRWNDPYKENEREWDRVKSSLSQIRTDLENYFYDPNESKINDTYDLIESKSYGYSELSVNHLTFLLPKSFITHSLDDLLTPLTPPELPKLPKLPPLQPTSVPDWYSKREKKDYYFRDQKWTDKAKQKLDPINFNNQVVSFEEAHIISNLVLTDESVEVGSMIEKARVEGLHTHSEAIEKLETLRSSLEVDANISSICKLIELTHKRHFLPISRSFSEGIRSNLPFGPRLQVVQDKTKFQTPSRFSPRFDCFNL